jgi:large subunit ribosomal protein L15
MPLYRRLPKRGFTPPNRTEYQIVNLRQLTDVEETELGPERLEELGLVDDAGSPVKILADGDVDRAFAIRAHAFSGSAREKIEEAGGTVEVIE